MFVHVPGAELGINVIQINVFTQ